MLPHRLELAAKTLLQGGVVAYPTEAVWGLGCNPLDPSAVNKLLSLKHRQIENGLILVAADIQQLAPYLQGLSATLQDKLHNKGLVPTTWLIPDNGFAPRWITGGHNRVAVRVSVHPVVVDLCRGFGGPIVSTSANITGRPALLREWQLRRCFGDKINYYLSGQLGGGVRPTEIRDVISDEVIRRG
jgi:L-threonylcarbamoyladenylate synthase